MDATEKILQGHVSKIKEPTELTKQLALDV